MAGYWEEDDIHRRIWSDDRRGPVRRPRYVQGPPGGYEEDEYTERTYRRAPQRREQQPTINIYNDNVQDDRDTYGPPPRRREEVVNNREVVYIDRSRDRSRDRDRDDKSYRTRRDLEELERLNREKHEHDLMEKVKKDIALKEAKAREEEEERKEREKKLKEKAVEEWKEKQEKEKREKEEKEKQRKEIGQEYMRQQLRKDGYTEEEIDAMMSEEKRKRRGHSPSISSSTSIVIANRPTFLKVHKKHIDPQTLDAYGLEWEWADEEYINILRWIPEAEREILFEHTRKLKEKKLIQFAEVETIEVKGVRKDRNGRLLMVRKKEDRARSKSPAVKKKFFLG